MARRPVPVFVGNISFETSEAMVRDLFSSVGPVMAVRFVQDKETGKAKGYGFVEFGDPALAEAAVRVLNGRELGGRALRVDFAEHPDGTRVVVGQRRDARPGATAPPAPAWTGGIAPFGVPAAQAAMSTMASAFASPTVPHGVGGAAPGAPADPLTARLGEVSPRQMHDILVQMRTLAASNPGQARALLLAHPALTRALFQAQLMLGMVASAAEGGPPTFPTQPQPAAVAAAAPPQVMGMPPPGMVGMAPLMPPGGVGPAPGLGGYGPPPGMGGGYMQGPQQGVPPPGWSQGPPPGPVAPPPGMHPLRGTGPGVGPPQQQQQGGAPPMAVSLGAMDPGQQHALLSQVLRLTDAQVAALPPAEQAQVAQLRHVARQMGLS